jgi:alpha-aminoadipic semialdehyde synthase
MKLNPLPFFFQEHAIAGDDLLKFHFPTIRTAYTGFVFEGLANRNSLGYADIYGLGDLKDMDTMFRGTLRYQGYSDLLYALKQLGFLDLKQALTCNSWVSEKKKKRPIRWNLWA